MLKNCMHVELFHIMYFWERLVFFQNHKLTLNINISKTQDLWILM